MRRWTRPVTLTTRLPLATITTVRYAPLLRRPMASISPKRRPRTALFFPGQGVQRIGMTTEWAEAFPRTCKPILEEIDETLQTPLTRIIAEGPNALLTATDNAQPAIMATSIMVLKVLEQEFGFDTKATVDVTLGHSLGEFAALVAGGYLRFPDALRLVRRRAEEMTICSNKAVTDFGSEVGMMAIVTEPDKRDSLIESIAEFLGHDAYGHRSDSGEASDRPAVGEVLIANINSKNQIVLSGSIARIRELLTHLRQFSGHDPRAVRLKADSPFHSPLMQPAKELMHKMLSKPSKAEKGEDIVRWPGDFPCVSNVSARPFQSREELKDLLARQCVETVLWHASIQYLDQEEKVRRWIGVGPGKVGRNLVGKEVGIKGAVKGGGVWGISEPREVEEVMKGLEMTEGYEEEHEEK
ncbi:malonyl CoA-acyl carrier protein transacylase [Myriangium duriaei CBS 260.36]|uniref:[acyl-carrier-protein] S-malonyltransferase n=1 Tax=Myriangium duriaei CBS 260.36 TaxID=1168546 RepID=A0A9P4J2T4_9PEZI|nr:malonyl CoA-acyl carrier protein transacylase [Myriangium duriaei CBS 260.36]